MILPTLFLVSVFSKFVLGEFPFMEDGSVEQYSTIARSLSLVLIIFADKKK